jgi:hypothetical protein
VTKAFPLVLATVAAVCLAACGGGSGDPPPEKKGETKQPLYIERPPTPGPIGPVEQCPAYPDCAYLDSGDPCWCPLNCPPPPECGRLPDDDPCQCSPSCSEGCGRY